MLDLQRPDLTPIFRFTELNALALCVVSAFLLAIFQTIRCDDWDLPLAVPVGVLLVRVEMAAYRMRSFADKL